MVLYSRIKFYFFLSKPGFHHLFDQSACLKMDADVHTPRGMWANASSVTLSSYHMLTPHHLLGLPGLGLPTGGGGDIHRFWFEKGWQNWRSTAIFCLCCVTMFFETSFPTLHNGPPFQFHNHIKMQHKRLEKQKWMTILDQN